MKISDKLSVVSESVTINRYDNGFMVEVSGKDIINDNWSSAKVCVTSIKEVITLLEEYAAMKIDS